MCSWGFIHISIIINNCTLGIDYEENLNEFFTLKCAFCMLIISKKTKQKQKRVKNNCFPI